MAYKLINASAAKPGTAILVDNAPCIVRSNALQNSNTCIITCSGNFNSMGLITNVNNEINRVLNFSKSEIIGQNINMRALHDLFVLYSAHSNERKASSFSAGKRSGIFVLKSPNIVGKQIT